MQESVQIVAHCAGSTVLFCSLLSGALDGKVRNVIASQVAFKTLLHGPMKLRTGIYNPNLSKALGLPGLTAVTDNTASGTEALMNNFVKALSYVDLPYDELCSNPVCHR